jgi:flap endonuclease-1
MLYVQGLSKLLADNAPQCVKDHKLEDYFGRKIAIDASMHIYQFLVRLFYMNFDSM